MTTEPGQGAGGGTGAGNSDGGHAAARAAAATRAAVSTSPLKAGRASPGGGASVSASPLASPAAHRPSTPAGAARGVARRPRMSLEVAREAARAARREAAVARARAVEAWKAGERPALKARAEALTRAEALLRESEAALAARVKSLAGGGGDGAGGVERPDPEGQGVGRAASDGPAAAPAASGYVAYAASAVASAASSLGAALGEPAPSAPAPGQRFGFNPIQARSGPGGRALPATELERERGELEERAGSLRREVARAREELSRARPAEAAVWETALLALADSERVVREQRDLLALELAGREQAARLRARRADAVASGAARLRHARREAVSARVQANAAKRALHYPDCKGYNVRFGGAGIFGATQDICISEIVAGATLELRIPEPTKGSKDPVFILDVGPPHGGDDLWASEAPGRRTSDSPSEAPGVAGAPVAAGGGAAGAPRPASAPATGGPPPPGDPGQPSRAAPPAAGASPSRPTTAPRSPAGGPGLAARARSGSAAPLPVTVEEAVGALPPRSEGARKMALKFFKSIGNKKEKYSGGAPGAPPAKLDVGSFSFDSAAKPKSLASRLLSKAKKGKDKGAGFGVSSSRSSLGRPSSSVTLSDGHLTGGHGGAPAAAVTPTGSARAGAPSVSTPPATREPSSSSLWKQGALPRSSAAGSPRSSPGRASDALELASVGSAGDAEDELAADPGPPRGRGGAGGRPEDELDRVLAKRAPGHRAERDVDADELLAAALEVVMGGEGGGRLAEGGRGREGGGAARAGSAPPGPAGGEAARSPAPAATPGAAASGPPAARPAAPAGGEGAPGASAGGSARRPAAEPEYAAGTDEAIGSFGASGCSHGAYARGRTTGFELLGEKGSKVPNLSIGLADVAAEVRVRFCLGFDADKGGWYSREPPLFDVRRLFTRLVDNNVPMPSALVRHILRLAIPGLIEKRLLEGLPRELGEYLIAARRGAVVRADVRVNGPDLAVLDADLAHTADGSPAGTPPSPRAEGGDPEGSAASTSPPRKPTRHGEAHRKHASAKAARRLLGLPAADAALLRDALRAVLPRDEAPWPRLSPQYLVDLLAHFDGAPPGALERFCDAIQDAAEAIRARGRAGGAAADRSGAPAPAPAGAPPIDLLELLRGRVAALRAKPARARVVVRQLDAAVDVHALLASMRDYTRRVLEDLFVNGTATGDGLSRQAPSSVELAARVASGDPPGAPGRGGAPAPDASNPTSVLPPPPSASELESLREQMDVLDAWHEWASAELSHFSSRFAAGRGTLVAAANRDEFSCGLEEVLYEGPLRVRMPLDLGADRDGSFTFACPLPSPVGSLGRFVDEFKAMTLPAHLRPPAASLNWSPLPDDPRLDALLRAQAARGLALVKEAVEALQVRAVPTRHESADTALSLPRTPVGDLLGRFLINRLLVRVRLNERRIGEMLAGLGAADPDVRRGLAAGPGRGDVAGGRPDGPGAPDARADPSPSRSRLAPIAVDEVKAGRAREKARAEAEALRIGRLLSHLGDVAVAGLVPAPPDPTDPSSPGRYLLRLESSDMARLSCSAQSLGFQSAVTPGGLVRLTFAILRAAKLAFAGGTEADVAALRAKMAPAYEAATQKGLDLSAVVRTEGVIAAGHFLVVAQGTIDPAVPRETAPLVVTNDLGLVALGKSMRGDARAEA